ncbi:phage tail sheath subtilisin-like domain-containing protein [Flavivirga jejuensis]|uniref:Phage tail sheath subtilisin-like domain-containing protein n=1 Tax=Flavivirga jejuensis TaxID=870487 RepID=A0ABT8WQE9_9FLAO|nr:phage tail sheath subtilisin-like domain-containing protein [Flavivirga jejuensis]MDO5975219.1 phage tail sheath subtilisin-like domain-containing protein [Flavivirga jejuensis]
MGTSFKTPGVYVEEISTFPPSVAQVETAIPAFIGYTKIAKKTVTGDLLNEPTKISSALEFVTFFGGAPDVNVNSIDLNALQQVTKVDIKELYYLYEAIRMFYANGGGDCYIVSVGTYGDTIENGDPSDPLANPGLLVGLDKIKKVDEPTLLIAPDAPMMSQNDMNSLYQAMLAQCSKLQDRFAILDTRENSDPHDNAVENFRNGIGMNNLKYGAIYTPWIKANLPRTVNYKDIKGKITLNGPTVNLSDLISDAEAKALADGLDDLVNDQATVEAAIAAIIGSSTSLDVHFEGLMTTLRNSTTIGNLEDVLQFLASVTDLIVDLIDAEFGAAVGALSLTHDSGDALTYPIPEANRAFLLDFLYQELFPSLDTGGSLLGVIDEIMKMQDDWAAGTPLGTGLSIPDNAVTGIDYDSGVPISVKAYFPTEATQTERITPFLNDIAALWNPIKSAIEMISSSTESFTSTFEESAIEAIPALKNIVSAIAEEYLELPPSSTLAGVYAQVDSNRGVWKAPANVTLNSVIGVTELIDKQEQESLNVDVVAGKSINAIRPFKGKGIMVWGARTLAGNDKEWRYIPVRRFFIMVEESVMKASEQFVFEPNDANTWVKVRAMIENFLVLQWRAGALAGAKPDDAFYVRVGLGETMTADDILDGLMNIEIGMAAVRPAEFIVLKFSHKMQES